ncbi:hypothetical protein B0H14DRAFT_3576824 [Mycena olivaceomarginata]|nr:hypothetical protein B0H14DRAFT_3576824 [Mycena olivaceomarginata]
MTKPSAAQKRKKRRVAREELERMEEEKARRPPVNTAVTSARSTSLPITHPVPIPVRAVPTAPQPIVDARQPYYMPAFRFPEKWLYENVPSPPSQWSEHIRMPATTTAIMTIVPAPRWSSLRSFGGHPWRAIRRRKRRLHADCSWQQPLSFEPHFDAPPTAPPLPVPLAPLQQGLSLRPADLLGLTPLHPDHPFHPDDVPLDDLPPPTLCLFPDDHPPSQFPVDTEYGPLVHGFPSVFLAPHKICGICWWSRMVLATFG